MAPGRVGPSWLLDITLSVSLTYRQVDKGRLEKPRLEIFTLRTSQVLDDVIDVLRGNTAGTVVLKTTDWRLNVAYYQNVYHSPTYLLSYDVVVSEKNSDVATSNMCWYEKRSVSVAVTTQTRKHASSLNSWDTGSGKEGEDWRRDRWGGVLLLAMGHLASFYQLVGLGVSLSGIRDAYIEMVLRSIFSSKTSSTRFAL